MPRVCTVCSHPEREAIERALTRGGVKRQIARLHGLTEHALARHERSHLPALLAEGEVARRAASAGSLLGEALALKGKALDLLALAQADGDLRAAVLALRELRECVELLGRIAERLAERAEADPQRHQDARDSLGAKLEALASRLATLPAVAGK